MRVCLRCAVRSVALIFCLSAMFGAMRAQAQDKQHVVSLAELNKDTARPAETRAADEAAVRQLFSYEQVQNALKSANLDYAKVDKAVGQLSDADLAKLAQQSRQLENNFAAGRMGSLSDRDLLIIIIVAVLLIALIAVLK
jgi:hypothetical protein